ncbi:MAG: hypothetical protein Q7J07_07060 [Pelolinea sp.]|nr:hypothetical protein [Pelolinea sp.]
MKWDEKTNQGVIDWLLEEDRGNPSVRYFALVDLFNEDPGSSIAEKALRKLMTSGPVLEILSKQNTDGYWVEPGSGYSPKYTSTVWSLIMLAQLGADRSDKKVQKACDYILEHTRAKQGCFSVTATQSGAVHCLQGNLAAALLELGMQDDPRLWGAIDWMARSITGDGFGSVAEKNIVPHYMRSGISGPGFLCSANDLQPCAWGAVKAAMALSKIPMEMRSPEIIKAINVCKTFLVGKDPAYAEYPHPYAKNPSGSWFKFGFPVFYVTDLLQNLSSLLGLGLAGDERLQDAVDLVESKQDHLGRWEMEYTYNSKTWVHIEEKNQPSKWITYRALSVLKKYYS